MFNRPNCAEPRSEEKKELYVTITGVRNYYGMQPFAIGNLIRCRKEPDNRYDCDAIKCTLPMVGKVGYIANSVGTVACGTMSAGRIYDRVGEKFYVRVMFTTNTKIICKVEQGDRVRLERELEEQQKKDDDWN